MISRDTLYDLLVQAFESYRKSLAGDADSLAYDQIRGFSYSIGRAPSGWSLDPALLADFIEQVPEQIPSAIAAVKYSASFIQDETLGTLGATSMKAIVEALKKIKQPSDAENLPHAFKEFVDRLFVTA